EKLKVAIQPVYVLSPTTINLRMFTPNAPVKQYAPSADKLVQEALKGCPLDGLLKPEVIVQRTELLRDAVRALVAYGRSQPASLIAVSTHANRGFSRLLLGSFAETLILNSKIPVLVINPAAQSRPIRKILFPSDLATGSKFFFRKVCDLAKDLGAEVELLHVI